MTLDPKAIDAAWNLYREGPHNAERFQESVAAYLAALPPVDVAGLVKRFRDRALWDGDAWLDAATALERVARERDEARRESAKIAAPCQINGCHYGPLNEELKRDREAAEARIAALEGALRRLMLGYVTLIESCRDRIIQLGGTCDDVTTMEAADPFLREARAALAQKGGDGWLPIESAPRDGSIVQLYRPPPEYGTWARRVTAFWHTFAEDGVSAWVWPDDSVVNIEDDEREWLEEGDYCEDAVSFTHWRPLPPPPAREGE